jgi:hypothetical protein
MAPRHRHAGLVQPSGQAIIIIRPVDIVLHVLLAGPHDLHWPIHLPGDLHGLGDAVHIETAAKAATEQVVVDPDLLRR